MKTLRMCYFFIFVMVCSYPRWKPYACGLLPCRMLALLWAQTSAHFFDVAKESLLSENTYDILTRAGPKTLPKKVPKNSFGGPSWAKNTETGQKNEKVCNLQKLFLLERARIESGIMRGTLSGRRPRGNHGNVLWKKRVFFQKTCVFQFKKA